jgi:hypothetical protein
MAAARVSGCSAFSASQTSHIEMNQRKMCPCHASGFSLSRLNSVGVPSFFFHPHFRTISKFDLWFE